MLADYHVLRMHKLRVNELYIGDSSSHYWFNHGLNWRAFVAFFSGVWPLLPGLAASVNGYTGPNWTNWTRLYNLTFLVGLAISFVVFLVLNYLSPVSGLGVDLPFLSDTELLDGRRPSTEVDEQVVVTDKKV
jgi:NCS1 family nucleobase:cation symporter-1